MPRHTLSHGHDIRPFPWNSAGERWLNWAVSSCTMAISSTPTPEAMVAMVPTLLAGPTLWGLSHRLLCGRILSLGWGMNSQLDCGHFRLKLQ